MKKALGQSGLDFIAGKYKEIKELVSKKADKSELPIRLSQLLETDSHQTVTQFEKTSWNNKVEKIDGKGLSTNDYDNTAKSKVDAIPSNPKYTDTTYDLSKYAEKADISRCKTKGYNTSSTWKSLSTERDLEDWIGDFDKRTRELKGNKGLTGDKSEISQQVIPCSSSRNCDLVAKKWGRYVELSFYYNYDSDRSAATSWEFMIPEKFIPGGNVYGKLSNGEYELVSPSNSSEARLTVIKEYGLRGGLIAGNIIYLARNQ